MRMLAIAIFALAGCLKGTYNCTTSSQCGASGVCEPAGYCAFPDTSCTSGLRYGDLSGPDSRVCVGQEQMPPDGSGSDGSGSGSCMTDTDGDGLNDCVDNCPTVANAGQENEDGDKFGDACDPCPPVADDNPPDSDGDGVADACDPRPTMAGDMIVLFEGFHHGIPSAWEQVGTWTNPTDDAASTSTTTVNVLSTPGPTTTHETVSAAMVVDQAATTLAYAGPLDDHAPGGNGIACEPYIFNGANPSPGLAINLTGTTTSGAVAYEMTTGATYILKLRRDGTSFTCDGINAGTSVAATATRAFTPPNAQSSVGLQVVGSQIRFHWLMVVSNP